MAYHFSPVANRVRREEGQHMRMAGVLQNAVAAGVLIHTLMAVQTGIQVYVMKKFEFGLLRKYIQDFRLSALFLAPVTWKRIAEECSRQGLHSMRFAMSGASPLSTELQRQVSDLLPPGVNLKVNWGMTETSCGATQFSTTEVVDTEGRVGRLLPGMQAIVLSEDDDGKTRLGPEQLGELCIRGEYIPYNIPMD